MPAERSAFPIYLVVVLLNLVSTAGIVVLYTMLATLYRVFDAPASIGWVVTSYLLVSALSAALCGRLGDLLGQRLMVLVVLALCGAGSLLSAMSSSLPWIIAGCVLQGTAGALTPLSIGIARESLPHERVPFAVGLVAAAGSAGGGLFFLISGLVIDQYSFHGGFMMKVVLSVLGAAAVMCCMSRPTRQRGSLEHIDLVRGILFAPAVAGIMIAVEKARAWGWDDPRVGGMIVLSLLIMVYWVRHQQRESHPLIGVRLLLNRQTALANLVIVCAAAGACELGQLLSVFLQQPGWTAAGFGYSATFAGWLLLPMNAVAIVASPWSGHVAAEHGARRAALIGVLLIVTAWVLMMFYHESIWPVMGAAFVSTTGFAVLYPAAFNLIVESTPADRTSEAAGMGYVSLSVAMALGAQIIFAILGSATVADPSKGPGTFPAASAYAMTFGYVLAMSVICFLFVVILPHRRELIAVPRQAAG